MTAHSHSMGHAIEFRNGKWIGGDVSSCAHCGRDPVPVELRDREKGEWTICAIDPCIANIVRALQRAGIDMRSSCCGHGQGPGEIALADGRILAIMPAPK